VDLYPALFNRIYQVEFYILHQTWIYVKVSYSEEYFFVSMGIHYVVSPTAVLSVMNGVMGLCISAVYASPSSPKETELLKCVDSELILD
jgi:hypothetical protein